MSQRRLPDPAAPEDPSTRHEPEGINATAVFLTGVGVLVVMWVVVVLIMPLFSYFKAERGIGPIVNEMPARVPPEPRIQSDPRGDLHEFRARELSALQNYAWVDRKNNVISIPIDRAIQLLAQRGVPPSPPAGDQYYKPEAGTRETGFEGKVEPEPR
ncbi:MAG TPA: hypothetical protein VFC10_06775 [Terriglobia bacterium]|nr:hypothetical protein [Terriglobia bacterium]